MSRGKKNTETATETKKPRTRKAKAAAEAPAQDYTPRELELRAKYPHQDILPQSYRVAGAEDRPGWGKKHTVLVKCCEPSCTAEPRCVATSDLQWQTTNRCVEHAKAWKKANTPKKAKKQTA